MPNPPTVEAACVSLTTQCACVAREVRMRERVYPRLINTGSLSEAKAHAELSAMRAVLATLQALAADSTAQADLPL